MVSRQHSNRDSVWLSTLAKLEKSSCASRWSFSRELWSVRGSGPRSRKDPHKTTIGIGLGSRSFTGNLKEGIRYARPSLELGQKSNGFCAEIVVDEPF